MIRAKKTSLLKHKETLKLAKGYKHRAKSAFKIAHLRVLKAQEHRFNHLKKHLHRGKSIAIIASGLKHYGITYSYYSKISNWNLINKKSTSILVLTEHRSFKSILEYYLYQETTHSVDDTFSSLQKSTL